jgi:Ca-activated chloride channel family protein
VAAQQMDGPLTITVAARSAIPFKGVSCPTHPDALAAAQQDSSSFRAGIEEPQGRLDRDFVLYFQLERPAMGVDLFTHKEGRDDGYFYLLVTPGSELDLDPQPLNLSFVIDSSGSMGEEDKLSAACRAAWAALQCLRPEDTFNIIAFNLAPTPLSDAPLSADESGIARAEVFLKNLSPRGGTSLVPAIEQAAGMIQPQRASAIVLLSDGEATDVQNHAPIVQMLQSRAGEMPRIASIGVGNEVNRPLLDRLARDTGGFVAYLSAEDNMADLAPTMIEKLRRPLAQNISVTSDAVELFDVTPAPLPNLYHGGQLALFGRYRGSGKGTLTLAADMLGERRDISINVDFPALDTSMPEIQRMWAWHQIQDLMRLINAGQETSETQQQIVALGTAFSITSPYTSFLVLENEQMYRDFNIERRNRDRIARERDAQQARDSGGQPGQHFYPSADYTPRSSGGGTGGGAISPLGLVMLVTPLVLGGTRRRRVD